MKDYLTLENNEENICFKYRMWNISNTFEYLNSYQVPLYKPRYHAISCEKKKMFDSEGLGLSPYKEDLKRLVIIKVLYKLS